VTGKSGHERRGGQPAANESGKNIESGRASSMTGRTHDVAASASTELVTCMTAACRGMVAATIGLFRSERHGAKRRPRDASTSRSSSAHIASSTVVAAASIMNLVFGDGELIGFRARFIDNLSAPARSRLQRLLTPRRSLRIFCLLFHRHAAIGCALRSSIACASTSAGAF